MAILPSAFDLPAGRLLALDLGQVRTGVAVCDQGGMLASPLGVLRRHPTRAQDYAEIAAVVARERVVGVLVGLPLNDHEKTRRDPRRGGVTPLLQGDADARTGGDTPPLQGDADARTGGVTPLLQGDADARAGGVTPPLQGDADARAGAQARWVRRYAGRLAAVLPVPVAFWDETLSTSDALARLAEGHGRTPVDAAAAAVLLGDFLEARNR